MAFRLVRSPTTVVYQGTPAVPAAPDRLVWWAPVALSGVVSVTVDARVISGTRLGEYLYLDPVVQYATRIPATAYVPATGVTVVTQGAKGWDGGGTTHGSLEAGGFFSFRLVAPIAAMAGLSRKSEYGFSSFDYAWYLHEQTLEILESGRSVYVFGTGIPEFVTSEWVLSIRRTGTSVGYYFNGNLVYTSENPSSGPLFGVATPYSTADSIADPQLGGWSQMGVTVPVVGCAIGDTNDQVRGILPPLVGGMRSFAVSRIHSDIPSLRAGLGSYARMGAKIPAFAGGLRSEPAFAVNALLAAMPGVVCGLSATAGSGGRIAALLPASRARIASNGYSGIESAVGVYVQSRFAEKALPIELDIVGVQDGCRLDAPLLLVSFDQVNISDISAITITLELRTSDAIAISGAASFGSIIELVANEQLVVNSGINTVARKEAIQYAVNVATGALAAYQGFDFDGFLTVGLDSFGWRPDGLYRIRKGDDAGESIRGIVDFGASDLRDSHSKRCAQAWVGVRTDGQVFLRAIADNGEERVYRASGDGNIRRYTMAKGVAGRNWKFGLEVVDASFAEVDSLELAVGVMQRKLNGRK